MLVLLFLLLSSGCRQDAVFPPPSAIGVVPTSTGTPGQPIPTASATQQPATPTATLTASATVSPQPATAIPSPPSPIQTPTSAATPAPSPQASAQLEVTIAPQSVQGAVLSIQVRAPSPMTSLRGDLAGQRVNFLVDGVTGWGLVGFSPIDRIGPRRLSLTALTTNGQTLQAAAQVDVAAGNFVLEEITLPPGQEDLLDPGLLQREWGQLIALASVFTPQKRWQGLFIPPAQGPPSSPYGARRSYNGAPPIDVHFGHDIAAALGSTAITPNDGVVVFAEEWVVRGNAVVIDHGIGVFSGSYHLAELWVTAGQAVKKGDPIGMVGATGMATGPHLHWDMLVMGIHTDPLAWTSTAFP